MDKSKRNSTQIHTRKLDRMVAKNQMKDSGMVNICHRHGLRGQGRSFFANNWRDYKYFGGQILV